MTHTEEILMQLHNQLAEMCRYLGVPREVVHDSWSLRDAIVELKRSQDLAKAEIDFEYGVGDGKVPPDTFEWETFE